MGHFSTDQLDHFSLDKNIFQWTFERTYTLVELYREVNGGANTITKEQVVKAEGMMIAREFLGDYGRIYTSWINANSSMLNTSMAAYDAGYTLCVRYEMPDDMYTKGVERGNHAKLIYADMMK